jgi:hypothetical protein
MLLVPFSALTMDERKMIPPRSYIYSSVVAIAKLFEIIGS